MNAATSCIDLNYGASNTQPVAFSKTKACITPNAWVDMNTAPNTPVLGRYLGLTATLRNSVGGNWVRDIFVSDMNLEEYH